jgi:hypothetical protein
MHEPRWPRAAAVVAVILLSSGCSSTQLNHNTLDLASTVGDLQTKQVLYNLSLFIDNSGAIPTHIDLSSGAASTTDSVTPTVTAPLGIGTQALNSATRTVSNAPSSVAQLQNTRTIAAPGLSVAASDLWTQNWNYQPVIDGDELRRLQALYKFALGQSTYSGCARDRYECEHSFDQGDLRREYPTIKKAINVTYNNAAEANSMYCPNIGISSTVFRANTYGKTVDKSGAPTIGDDGKPTGNKPELVRAYCTSIASQIAVPDERYLQLPSCILCLGENVFAYGPNTHPDINPRLAHLGGASRRRWLLFERDELPPDAELLGQYGQHDLFIRRRDRWKLSEFTLFVLTATAQSAAANLAAGTSGQQKKQTASSPGGQPLFDPTTGTFFFPTQ